MAKASEKSWKWCILLLEDLNRVPINVGYRNTYGYIYGACIALQETIVHLQHTRMDIVADRMELLPQDGFNYIVQKDGYVRWKRDKTARLYASEFYLNKAQANIAAAVDTILNQWMIDRLPGPYGGNEQRVSYDLLYLYFVTRLSIVASIRHGQGRMGVPQPASNVFDTIGDDWSRVGNFFNTDVASRVIGQNVTTINALVEQGEIAELIPPLSPRETKHLVFTDDTGVTTPLTIVDCLSTVCARVNAFKHFPRGHDDRTGAYHYTEWAITARALLCVRELFRDKLASVPEGPTLNQGASQ